MFLDEVMTPKAIEELYDLPHGSVRRDLARDKFRKSEIRKSGSTWIITAREAKRFYKGELTMIKVINSWDWVSYHVDQETENTKLWDVVSEYLNKKNISYKELKELYQQGLETGMDSGKYLSFSQWFYLYKESEEEWEGYDTLYEE